MYVPTCRLVSYCRVSTDQQGRSGLGLEAQRAAVPPIRRPERAARWWPSMSEVESGKRNDRPELGQGTSRRAKDRRHAGVRQARPAGAQCRFLLGLVESGADLIFCDIPQVPPGPLGKFMLTQLAAVAELEAGLIGQRTRAALAAAKARGVKLGGYRGEQAARAAAAAKAAQANAHAHRLKDMVAVIRAGGMASATGLAKELNRRGITTARGGSWQTVQAQRLLARLDG